MTRTISFVTTIGILFLMITGTCRAVDISSGCGGLYPARFTVGLQGTPDMSISQDIIAVRYEDRTGKMEITLKNWDGMQYKYSEGNQFTLGAQISLFLQCANPLKVSEGSIVSIEPKFLSGEAPTILIVASGSKSPQSNRISLNYGASLREFYPVLKSGGIECKGRTDGMPDLRTGTVLSVGGVGQTYSGEYTVTGTLHTFDMTKGYTTQFTAKRGTSSTRSLPSSTQRFVWPNTVR